jgi:peptidylprolyl isomerase
MSEIIIIAIILALILLSVYRVYKSSDMAQNNAEHKQASIDFMVANADKEDVETTQSGLQHTLLQAGTGSVHPTAKDKVQVHYEGTFIDGRIFDSSVKRGKPTTFGLNQVIKGWTEGLQLMVVGEKRRFYIPAKLGYGNRWTGNIPPGSTLIFDVELLAINS